MYRLVLLLLVLITASTPTLANDADTKPQTLFTNVNVFDGENEALIENANVLIEGDRIKTVSTDAIKADGAKVIDGGGRTLMTGIIGCHEHVMTQLPITTLLNSDERYIAAVATNTG
jgi:imidazolonepropionase-like amidohydrolase